MCCGPDKFRITPEGVLQYKIDGEWVSVSNFPSTASQDINAKTVQNVVLTQVPNGDESFIPERLVVIVKSAAGVTGQPTISVGVDGADYDDIVDEVALTANATGEYEIIDIDTLEAIAAGSTIYLRVSIGATGTTFKISASLEGRYVRL